MSVASTLTTLYTLMLHYHCYHHCTSLSQNSHSDVSCQYSHHTVHTNVTLPLLSSLYITVPTQSVLSVASTLATLCTLMLHYHFYHHCTSLSQNSHNDVSCQYSHHTVYTLMLHCHYYHHCTSLSQHSHSDVSCQYSHHTVHINVTLPLLSSLYITVPTQSVLSVASTLTTLYTLLLHYHCYHHCTSLSQHSQCCQLPVLSPHCTHYCYITIVIITVHQCPNTVTVMSVASTLTTLYTSMLHYHCYYHCTALSQHSHSDVSCQYSHHTVHINVTLPLLSSLYISVSTQSQ